VEEEIKGANNIE